MDLQGALSPSYLAQQPRRFGRGVTTKAATLHQRPHVVIVGGGFGGLAAARGLASADVDITLIDKRNHHLFQPLLYQVATAGLNPADIAQPIRSILRSQANVRVLLSEVTEVNPVERTVKTSDGTSFDFDYLIVAAGATHSYFGHDEWEALAPGLKTVEDALEVRRRVLVAFERAERSDEKAERQSHLTFVVIGGGPTGVETAGAIAEIAFKTLTREFRSIDPTTAKVILLEGTDRILRSYPERLSAKAEDQLERLGVEVRTDTTVTGIDEHCVQTTTGPITARTTIWCAGNEASPLGAMVGAEIDRAGRVMVEADLSVRGQSQIFAIGDVAHASIDGKLVPGVAQGAIQGGTHVALAIRADLDSQNRPDFQYRNKGELATIGRSSAVGVIGRFKLSGWIAWMAWWTVHIFFLIDFRSRFTVLFNWAWSYLTFQRGARLITGPWRPRRGQDEDRS